MNMNGLVTELVIFVRNTKYPGRHITSGRIDIHQAWNRRVERPI
jgi:hypothetical protein